ncbi:hypothetical protein L6452_33799 [Arctium lappa]|uniref:Uncharacterized protein n=1 Tax=Arctium lappa TaxID=4217 RepID=A0ACB8YGG1_ARCLA|nr:hypothetical protein L6452_33799 [Arctium lappa]
MKKKKKGKVDVTLCIIQFCICFHQRKVFVVNFRRLLAVYPPSIVPKMRPLFVYNSFSTVPIFIILSSSANPKNFLFSDFVCLYDGWK